MNSKITAIWFAVAAALFAFIFFFERHWRSSPPEPARLFSHLRPDAVTSVQVIPAGAPEIRADRTNGGWLLTQPILYPAQSAAIEMLLDVLQKLTPGTRITGGELRRGANADTEFGFEPPQISLVIEAGAQRWQLRVGNKTPPGDQVFLRLVGIEGAFVADAGWLQLIPRSAGDWRDTSLASLGNTPLDWILLTNGTKVIELRRHPTNNFWRMTVASLQARADGDRIADALQRLQTARVSRFVTDAKADLTAFGLQPADLDLWLGRGTNFVTALHVGKSLTNDSAQVFAKREGWNTVVATAKEPLSSWYGAVNDFRDRRLLELTTPVAEIEVSTLRSPDAIGTEDGRGQNNFTLQRHGSNDWQILGEKFPVDAERVQQFIKTLAGLRIAEFVKDVVTAPDWPAYGLATPARQILLRSAAGDTNSVIVQLSFGSTQTNEVFVRRADEDFVYAVTTEDFGRLPEAGWEFRDRRIWSFNTNDVAQITIHQNGKTRQIVRNGPNKWSLAPGSQGIIDDLALDEVTHRLGELAALGWVGRNVTEPGKYGLGTNNLQITVELKNGEKPTVDFGENLPQAQTALAAVTLEGECWAFVFPPALYQFVLSYLTIPVSQSGTP
jgi:hypothetical protein